MTITLDLPKAVEECLRATGQDPAGFAKEALVVELYRQGKLYHSQLAEALGLSRYEADGLLKRHGVVLELSSKELADDIEALQALTRE